MSNKTRLSIVDQPLQGGEKDGLKTELYRKGLCRFIEQTDTPITVALQGEWGSGKTSLMNALKNELCDEKGKSFFPVWINTWHHAMMANAEMSVVSILQAMIEQLCAGLATEKKNETWSKFVGFGKRIGKVIAVNAGNVAGGMVGMKTLGTDVANAAASEKEPAEAGVAELKESIEALIKDLLSEKKKDGVIFFIDDLDRIDPPVAVQILELLKNIFDIKNCVFVLAIDYDVVVKGLKNKFGEMTAANEREFRSFFDKIIQLPFSMPVNAYQIDDFLIENLRKIEFITDSEADDDELKQTLTDLAQLSVGRNPRSLKRLMNTLSLIQIMSKLKIEQQSDNMETTPPLEKKLNFALVCLQICYPAIYNLLTREPNFKEDWNDAFATALELPELTSAEKERFNNDKNFDEPWEQLLYRVCQKSPFLKQHALDISRLLNKVAELIVGSAGANGEEPDKVDIGEYVRQAIEISAVTNVQTSENAAVRVENRTLDSGFKREFRDKFAAEVNRIVGSDLIKVSEYRSKYMYLFVSGDVLNSVVMGFSSDDKNNVFRIMIEHKFEFMSGATDMNCDPMAAGVVGESEIRRLLSEFAAKYRCDTQLPGSLTATRGNQVCISFSFVWVNAGHAMADVTRIASAFADYYKSVFMVHLAERQYGAAKRPLMDYLRAQDKVDSEKRWLDGYELGGVVQRLTKSGANDAPYTIFRLTASETFSILIGNVNENTLENYIDADAVKMRFAWHTDGQYYVKSDIPAQEIVDHAKELFALVRT